MKPDRKTCRLTGFVSTLLLIGCLFLAPSPAGASERGAAQRLQQVKSSPSKMIRYLKTIYPNGNLTLHAGELVPGLTPPQNLRFHIREAVNVAGAQRIGHGADLRWERNPAGILRSMKKKRTCIEINLTSNRQTMGLTGRRHPFPDYVKAGVRTTLSTDDEGVERTDLTSQYSQAVRHYGYGYRTLKKFAKTGLQCSFLPASEKQAAIARQQVLFNQFERRFKPKKKRKVTRPRN